MLFRSPHNENHGQNVVDIVFIGRDFNYDPAPCGKSLLLFAMIILTCFAHLHRQVCQHCCLLPTQRLRVLFGAAMSNPRPSRKFCAAQFRFRCIADYVLTACRY